jgi:hypothetical protein
MRSPAGEIPQVVLLHVRYKALAILVNRRDPRIPLEHYGPFARPMPVQFADTPPAVSRMLR